MLQDTVNLNNEIKQKNGVIYYWDIDRSKWVGIYRETFYFFHNKSDIDNSLWLRLKNKIPSNIEGYIVTRNSVITLIYASCKYSSDVTFLIKRNNETVPIYSLDLTNELYKIEDLLNIDLNTGDYIQCFMEVNDKISYPIVGIEISARD